LEKRIMLVGVLSKNVKDEEEGENLGIERRIIILKLAPAPQKKNMGV